MENIIAVRVDNSHNPDVPPLNADFNFYGGIYRDVRLIITDPVHIDVLNYGSPGIFINTPEISNEKAKIKIKGTVVNDGHNSVDAEIVNRIFDKDNTEVAVLKSSAKIKNGSKENFEQEITIENFHLWSPENPYLYKVQTEIYSGKILDDEITIPIGLRWFKFDSQNGFSLNDKPIKLSGTNRHQDYDGYGNALPDSLHQKDIQIIKENGFNFLRLAHYPQDQSVLQSSDELGLIIWEEIPVVNLITLSKEFDDNCKNMLTEMIRQHYNHPSILFWGYMNEIMLRKPEIIPQNYNKNIVLLAKELESLVKKEDNSRATVMALSYGEIENGTGIADVADILGMNLYFGWYYEKIEALGEFLDGYHQRHPERPIIISEYGAGSDERIHSLQPKAFDFSTEYQQIFHEKTFPQFLERKYILGSAVWNQFDFGSNHREDTKPLINQKGIYYFDRSPKDISYYYKAKLLNEPVLHVAADDWNDHTDNGEDAIQKIKIYSNLEYVSIFLNDSLLGNYKTKNCSAELFLSLKEGKNIIRAAAEFNNKLVEDIAEIFYTDLNSFFDGADREILAINVGADFEYVNEESAGDIDNANKKKIIWLPDNNYNWNFTGGIPVSTHHRIYKTKDEPIYQTALEGIESFHLKVPDGNYLVQLYFAEIQSAEPGERIFNVYINNIPVINNLDLSGIHQKYYAYEGNINTTAKNNDGILIRFEAVKGKSILNGIKVIRIRY